VLKLAMLPARQGDSLWITYGPQDAQHHLLIDGGPERSDILRSRICKRLNIARTLHIDLLVVTHVDNDHIGGVLELLEDLPHGLTFGDIWFNAYRHLLPPDVLGPDQGDRLSEVLDKRGLPWNVAFGGGPVVIPSTGDLPRLKREDGLVLTLLGPDRDDLKRLHEKWCKVVNEKGEAEETASERKPEDILGRHDVWPPDISELARKDFESDRGEANGSSIALLVEYDTKSILCAADAFAGRIASSLDRLPVGEERLKLDAFKLSHHGSRKSTSSDLLKRVACSSFLISTNGSYFGHPDAEAMARVLIHGGKNPEFVFNSSGPYASRWTDPKIRNAPTFRTRFPDGNGDEGIEISF
jgi:beta-lactamase superfamily II metal-dependent hydrolase